MLPALSFGAPWILLGLLVLPAIWWLLRVTPPAPRRVVFPPLRLLLGLTAPQETPARTPLWLLILRICAAGLLIIALAEPSIGRAPAPLGRGPVVLLVDNGWPSAPLWQERSAALSEALAGAAHAGRPVILIGTASPGAVNTSLLNAAAAERAFQSLVPEPWLPDRARVLRLLKATRFDARPEIRWFSDGLDYGDARTFADGLAKLGRLSIRSDPTLRTPFALAPPRNQADGFTASVLRAGTEGTRSGTIEALGAGGEQLATAAFRIPPGARDASVHVALPLEVRDETEQLVVANEDSAGAVALLDRGAQRRAVEVVSASNAQTEQPLLSDTYYLERALAPYADVHAGTVSDGIARHVSAVILANVGNVSGSDHDALARFVSAGGLLIRFAGGRMTSNVDDLVPVKLRVGARYLGGALTWSSPQHLASFPDPSPFRGLDIPQDVTITRQVLAEPSVELSAHTWARLDDGTPLVTGAARGKGWIVLFHVTASPAWSSLPLSGLYLDMLRRLLELAGGARPQDMAAEASAVLQPFSTLDGFGHTRKPPAEVLPVRVSEIGKFTPSQTHPPGFYGNEGAEVALNTVNPSMILNPLSGVAFTPYAGVSATALKGPLLAFAIFVLLCDALISLWLRGYLPELRRPAVGTRLVAIVAALVLMRPFLAHGEQSFDEKAALDTRLAYVITGLPDVDATSKAGLVGLGKVLATRTSYMPKDPMGVDIDHDNLAFFPLLYWPMDPREKDLSPQAISKVADYMRNGGTILFDTRDLTLGATRGAQSPGEQTLRRITAHLDLPPLEPVPADHVLTKTFYLIDDFPGRWQGGTVWVETLPPPDPDAGPEPARGGDGVSPVIIGSNDWAAAWATDDEGRPLAEPSPGGEDQREMAYRFGVNVVMYAFTGNYKTDQVHAPAILQRLGH